MIMKLKLYIVKKKQNKKLLLISKLMENQQIQDILTKDFHSVWERRETTYL